MRRFALLLLLVTTPAWPESPDSLFELLQQVQDEMQLERQHNADRLQRFIAAQEEQQSMLAAAEHQLQILQDRGRELQQQQLELTTKLQTLEQGTRNNQEAASIPLHQAVRTAARLLREQIHSSVISAEHQNREALLIPIQNQDAPPTLAQIEALWRLQLEELVETGRVTRFQASLINAQGDREDTLVTRVGAFNLIADGRYLRYLPSTGTLVEPDQQPPKNYLEMARQLENATEGPQLLALDPSRGSILKVFTREPSLGERIHQGLIDGGLIGWIIIGVGTLGLLLGAARLYALMRTDRRIRRQLTSSMPDPGNPLGRILEVYQRNPDVDTETLELKLDEAILKELPRIKWGLGSLSVMAAIAPLLGLLGTVTGIIETFHSITLQGGSDPKMMSGGISQALVTTVEGLVIAIPLMLLHSFLSSRSNSLIQILDEQSAAMVARLAEQQFESRRGYRENSNPI